MKTNIHGITLSEHLFEDLLRQHDKSVMLQGGTHMNSGDFIQITEITEKGDISTGRKENFIIIKVTPMSSSAFNGLVLLKLQKCFEYQ